MKPSILILAVPVFLAAGCSETTQPSAPDPAPPVQGAALLPACSECVFPPTAFVRQQGQTKPYTRVFAADPAVQYVLTIQDDGAQTTAAEVTLNGAMVVRRQALQGLAISTVQVPVSLQASNQLGVLPLGRAGATVIVQIAPVAGPGRITSVTVTPDGVSVTPGQQVQMVASVTADAGVTYTVTWQSSDPTRATVTNTGLVSILANAPLGPVSIQATATSPAGATASGAATLTIANPDHATVSFSGIIQGPWPFTNYTCGAAANGTPANLACVGGQLNVGVNLDRGSDEVVGVDLLIDTETGDSVFATQTFGTAAPVAPGGPMLQVEQLTFPVSTAYFDPASGNVALTNRGHAMWARVRTANNTQAIVSSSISFTTANVGGFVATVGNTKVSSATGSATDAAGLLWTEGDITMSVVGVVYKPGVGIASVAMDPDGAGFLAPKAGPSATWAKATALPSGSRDYQTPVQGSSPVILGSALTDGSAGPTVILNATQVVLRHDNLAPTPPINSGTGFNEPMGSVWVNGPFPFTPGPSTGLYLGVDAGVGGVTADFWVGGLPSGPSGSCTTSGLAQVATGADLVATTVSTAYRGRAVSFDALGNQACADLAPGGILSGTFGADFMPPTGILVGPAHGSAASSLGAYWAVPGATDNASGFFVNTMLSGIITRLNPNGSTDCVLGSGPGCVTEELRGYFFDAYDGEGIDGYYTLKSLRLLDQAGNALVFSTPRTYLLDQVPAAFSASMMLQALYIGNAPATFTTAVTDNLDLKSVYAVIGYPTATIQYPPRAIGTYGAPLQQAAPVSFEVPRFIRCLNGPGDFWSTTSRASVVDMFVSDFAQGSPTSFGGFGIPAGNVEACDGVGNFSPSDINSVTMTAPDYGAGKSQIDIDGAGLAASSSSTVTLSVVADVILYTGDPFSRMEFYYQNAAGNWVKVGQAAGMIAQTPTNRTFTYQFVWNPETGVPVGNFPVAGIGVDAHGDAVMAGTVWVDTVP